MNIVCMSNFALTSFKCKEDHHLQLNRWLIQLRKESLKKFRLEKVRFGCLRTRLYFSRPIARKLWDHETSMR